MRTGVTSPMNHQDKKHDFLFIVATKQKLKEKQTKQQIIAVPKHGGH